ncbi:MAG: hypothetical protein MUC55_11345 [Burkholderiales bacterium]|jgi:hypothetical protein|nr:hypothetical protein [Burkholderiales bacterium]
MLQTPAVRTARAPAEAPAGERFTKWEPVAGLPSGPSRLVELRDRDDGLALTIAFDHPVPRALQVQFSAPLAHRRSSFEVFIRIWSMEVPYPWYTVENSRWIRWLHEESFGQFASASLAHYVITTSRDFIEILAPEAPAVRWLDL